LETRSPVIIKKSVAESSNPYAAFVILKHFGRFGPFIQEFPDEHRQSRALVAPQRLGGRNPNAARPRTTHVRGSVIRPFRRQRKMAVGKTADVAALRKPDDAPAIARHRGRGGRAVP